MYWLGFLPVFARFRLWHTQSSSHSDTIHTIKVNTCQRRHSAQAFYWLICSQIGCQSPDSHIHFSTHVLVVKHLCGAADFLWLKHKLRNWLISAQIINSRKTSHRIIAHTLPNVHTEANFVWINFRWLVSISSDFGQLMVYFIGSVFFFSWLANL